MRLTTDFWVSALIRTVFNAGGFAAVIKRGATEAGAVFITVRDRLGQVTLYGPALQGSYEEGEVEDRLFALLIYEGHMEAIEQKLAREAKFDSDIWVIELEPGERKISELLNVVAN